MTNILQLEFFRLKKSALFWSLLAVCAILSLASALLNYASIALVDSIDFGGNVEIEMDVWEYADSLNITALALSSLPSLSGHALFALICTSIFLCKEFSGGTFRNMILANRSRTEVYLSFLLMSVTIGACYLGVTFVSTLLFNGIMFGFGTLNAAQVVTACVISLTMGLITVIFLQALMCMFMFGTRKLSVALACPLVICIIAPSVIYSFVETFAQFGVISTSDTSWIPLYNLNLLDLSNVDGALIGKILLYIIPLAALFGWLGWHFFRKADLK